MTDLTDRQMMLLELLYDSAPDELGRIPAVIDLFKVRPDDTELLENRLALQKLSDRNLINLSLSMNFDGDSAYITDDGRAEVWRMQARREDPAELRVAAENGLLRHLYRRDPNGINWTRVDDFLHTDGSKFLGTQLSSDLVYRISKQLVADGLLEGGVSVAEREAPLEVKLTRDGRDCVELGSGVNDFLRQSKQAVPSQTFHITATSGNAFNWGANVSQSVATTTTTGTAGDELRALIQAILQAVPALKLSEDGQREVTASAQAVECELVRAEPDQGVVRTHVRRILEAVNTEVGSQLGQLLIANTKALMAAMGSPIE